MSDTLSTWSHVRTPQRTIGERQSQLSEAIRSDGTRVTNTCLLWAELTHGSPCCLLKACIFVHLHQSRRDSKTANPLVAKVTDLWWLETACVLGDFKMRSLALICYWKNLQRRVSASLCDVFSDFMDFLKDCQGFQRGQRCQWFI